MIKIKISISNKTLNTKVVNNIKNLKKIKKISNINIIFFKKIRKELLKMSKFNNKDYCWNKASKIKIKNLIGKKYQLEVARAIIKYEEYGLKSELGWNIDHIINTSFTRKDKNIRTMHWKNNEKKDNNTQILGKDSLNQVVYHRELVYDSQKNINIKNNKGMSFTNDIAKDK